MAKRVSESIYQRLLDNIGIKYYNIIRIYRPMTKDKWETIVDKIESNFDDFNCRLL